MEVKEVIYLLNDKYKILNKNKNLFIQIFLFLVLILFTINRCNNLSKLKNEKELLVEEKIELKKRIDDEKNKLNSFDESDKNTIEQLNLLVDKIKILSIENESEFKKMIYIFCKESGLKLGDVSSKNKVLNFGDYSMYYVHFKMKGDMNSFGQFMYLINKSKKYIDTSKMYIKLSKDEFEISLGYISKNK